MNKFSLVLVASAGVFPKRRSDGLVDVVEYWLHTNPWENHAIIASPAGTARPAMNRVPMALRKRSSTRFSARMIEGTQH